MFLLFDSNRLHLHHIPLSPSHSLHARLLLTQPLLAFAQCPPGSVPTDEAVRIFVQFMQAESAQKCQTSMHGRFFGGRRVHASFFDIAKFNKYELGPSAL